ncbi:MAG TPA: gamma carbonic anhydrase family protein [bacterium]|nr:gamma carbonic anhydrase family protein [bacterium]
MILPYKNKKPVLAEGVFVAEGARLIGDVTVGEGSSIWFNTVIRGDVFPVSIGKKTNIQDLSVLHVTSGTHATVIEDEVTVGHRVILHGCWVKSRALIGMGAILLDGCEVGEESLIGAGSLVTPGTIIPPRVLALGSPCKARRPLTEEEIAGLKASAEHYAELARTYLQARSS